MPRPLLLLALLLVTPPAVSEVVYEGPSMFGPLVVRDRGQVRSLHVGDETVEQTAIRKGQPLHLVHEYNRLLVSAIAARPQARRVLVVGLGGGALPRFLQKKLPRLEQDVVEIDPAVVEAAKRFFELVPDERLRIHVADARAFLERTEGRWDVIVLDAYAGDSVPDHLAGADFLKLARQRLAPGGVLASNVWGPPSPQYERLLASHRAAFPDLLVVEGQSDLNHILLGVTDGPAACAPLVKEARKMKLPYPLHEGIERGCSVAGR